MFALLQHTQPNADPAVHWDLLIETEAAERLPTWRLAANPLDHAAPIAAQRIPDHRRRYLDYEGPISGGRGDVIRVDRGGCTVLRWSDDRIELDLAGEKLRGRFVLSRRTGDTMQFEHAATP